MAPERRGSFCLCVPGGAANAFSGVMAECRKCMGFLSRSCGNNVDAGGAVGAAAAGTEKLVGDGEEDSLAWDAEGSSVLALFLGVDELLDRVGALLVELLRHDAGAGNGAVGGIAEVVLQPLAGTCFLVGPDSGAVVGQMLGGALGGASRGAFGGCRARRRRRGTICSSRTAA